MGIRKAISAFATLGAIAVTGAAVSGCGASATIDPVAQAADTTSQLAGAQVSLVEQLSSPALPQGFTLNGHGYINQHNRDAVLVFDFSSIPGISRLGGGSKLVTMEVQYPVLYMNAPFLSQAYGGKDWVKLDLSALVRSQGINPSGLSSAGGLDPNQFLGYLRASSGDVSTVGPQTIDGTPTTHYRATIQLDRVPSALPAAQRAAARASVAQLEKTTGLTSFPIDVWIDGQHRVRRESFSLSPQTRAGTVTVNATIDFLSFGPTPTVTPPPADQVFDATSLVTGAIQNGGGAAQG